MNLFWLRGVSQSELNSAAAAKTTLRAEIFKRIALGGGWSVGAAVVFGAFQLLRSNPTDAFPLLKAWGPWAIVTIVALYVFYDLVRILMGIGNQLVQSVEKLAVAQQQLADKDDRQTQEMQTLTSYTAQQTERLAAKIAGVRDQLKEISDKLDLDHTSAFNTINAKLDAMAKERTA
jgi:methyl-accepting chemotaxis protein